MECEKIFANHNRDKEIISYTSISYILISLFNNIKINHLVKNEKELKDISQRKQ